MEDLIREINQFRDDRDWRQFHNAKSLALSVSLEASELLENFQWKSSEEAIADDLGLDLISVIKSFDVAK
ncbi:nucleotide pyrophosphohydrolase [Vagococcus entomophilus]|uniref:Nucleotide pyrophosphohydrolase n=1 Tax=Vagococcus entomophilus TaxID=1160095 RepID=A0A430AHC7_9ENTE|nr:nucleotide pyrophosphohydrolase [Vagococcus entomophilus]